VGSTRIPSSPLKHSLEQPSAQKKKRLSSTGAVLCRSAEEGTLQRVQVIDFRGLVLALEVTLFSTVLDRIFLCFYTCDSASPVESCSGATRVADGHGMRPCLTRALSLLGCTGSVLSVICHARRCQALGPPMRCWHPMTEPTPLRRHKAPIRCSSHCCTFVVTTPALRCIEIQSGSVEAYEAETAGTPP
jgi:hypothetical protein